MSQKTYNVINYGVRLLDQFVNKLGYNGYLFIGFLAATLMFISTLSIRFVPSVNWQIFLIVRGVSTYFFSSLASLIFNIDTTFKGNSLKYVSIRNLLMGLHQVYFQYALIVLPINVVWVILNSAPLFVFIVNYFLFGSQLTIQQIVFLLLSLFGVCLITNPSIYFYFFELISQNGRGDFKESGNLKENGDLNEIEEQKENISNERVINYVGIGFIFAQVMWSYAVSVVKKARETTSLQVNMHLGLVLIAYGSLLLFNNSDTITMPPLFDLFKAFLSYGIGSFIPSLLFIQGTIIAKCQGRYSLTNYVTVFYSYLFQIFYEHKNPSIIELFGIFLAFFGLYKMLVK